MEITGPSWSSGLRDLGGRNRPLLYDAYSMRSAAAKPALMFPALELIAQRTKSGIANRSDFVFSFFPHGMLSYRRQSFLLLSWLRSGRRFDDFLFLSRLLER